jgi:hypothetical protein
LALGLGSTSAWATPSLMRLQLLWLWPLLSLSLLVSD